MIMPFNCPLCGQVHHLIVTQFLLRGKETNIYCSVTGEYFNAKLELTFNVPASFEKADLEIAEEAESFTEHEWKTQEEEKNFAKDKDQ